MRHKTAAVLFGIALFLTILTAAVPAAVYDKAFFIKEADNNEVALNTGMTRSEISDVTDGIFDYLKGERKDFDITVARQDKVIHLFNENEQKHMVDVENLMIFQRTVLIVCLFLSLIIGVVLYRNHSALLLKTLRITGIAGLVITGLAACIASTGFTDVFFRLHEMIFSNDLWLMDPSKEVLINIVPEPYFIDLAIYTGILIVFGCILSILAGIVFRKKATEK